jgi:hypothetical protein
MLFAIQFPIADSRLFVDISSRTSRPVWPYAEPDTDFVRFFGIIRERKAGGVSGWGSGNENVICEARRALTFDKNLSFIDEVGGSKFIFRRAFQRFYHDGIAVGKFEIGLATKKNDRIVASQQQISNIITHFLKLPITVSNPVTNEKKKTVLIQARDSLAKLYFFASTAAQSRTTNLSDWLVASGTPLLFLECDEDDEIEIPSHAISVQLPTQYDLKLFHWAVLFNGKRIHMWILNRALTANVEKARAMRLHLLRLHSEYQCLRLILRNVKLEHIAPARGTKESDNLQMYFDEAITRIGRLESKSGEIADIARQANDELNLSLGESLTDSIKKLDIRRNVLRKIINCLNMIKSPNQFDRIGQLPQVTINISEGNQDIMTENYNIGPGSIVSIKSRLENVTQNIDAIPNADQATKDELKKLLEDLTSTLQTAKPENAREAAAVAKTAERLVSDAGEEQSDKSMVQISADGLKKAAQNIASVLPEVLPIATKIITTIIKMV